MRLLMVLLLSACLTACGEYEVKNLAKSDVDMVADEFIKESRRLVMQLMVKLYKRNPDQMRKYPGLTIEGRAAQLRVNRHELSFDELGGKQGIDAMNLAFDPAFHGDRVFALTVGLGSMMRQAYSYKPEMFMFDQLNGKALWTSARNVEILAWKLRNARKPDGEYFLISHEYQGVVDNLSFERLFGKLIVMQELMARIAGDADDRAVTAAVHTVGRAFIPLPI